MLREWVRVSVRSTAAFKEQIQDVVSFVENPSRMQHELRCPFPIYVGDLTYLPRRFVFSQNKSSTGFFFGLHVIG